MENRTPAPRLRSACPAIRRQGLNLAVRMGFEPMICSVTRNRELLASPTDQKLRSRCIAQKRSRYGPAPIMGHRLEGAVAITSAASLRTKDLSITISVSATQIELNWAPVSLTCSPSMASRNKGTSGPRTSEAPDLGPKPPHQSLEPWRISLLAKDLSQPKLFMCHEEPTHPV